MKKSFDSHDPLRRFVTEHREDFNEPVPDLNALWEGINTALPEQPEPKRKISQVWIWRAATVLLGTALALSLWMPKAKQSQPADMAFQQESQSLNEAERYYTGLIHSRQTTATALFTKAHTDGEEIKRELEALDKVYASLKEQWLENADERIKSAMISNLRLRVEILNRQIQVMSQPGKTDKHEQPIHI